MPNAVDTPRQHKHTQILRRTACQATTTTNTRQPNLFLNLTKQHGTCTGIATTKRHEERTHCEMRILFFGLFVSYNETNQHIEGNRLLLQWDEIETGWIAANYLNNRRIKQTDKDCISYFAILWNQTLPKIWGKRHTQARSAPMPYAKNPNQPKPMGKWNQCYCHCVQMLFILYWLFKFRKL
jgi:hypothetical protein